MITIEQLKEVKERTESLNRYLDIDGKKMQYEEEQIRTQDPSFWEDAKRAEAQMKLVKNQDELRSASPAHVPLLTPYPPGPGAAAGWALQEPPGPQRRT